MFKKLKLVSALNTEEQPAKETSAEAPLIGESRQSMAVRGGYLNTRPTGVILLLTIELVSFGGTVSRG